jgi:cysteine desulfurase
MEKIYMDNGATTPVDSRVVDAMLPYFTRVYGNASSMHSFGREADEAIEESRAKIASFLGAQPREIVFTSSGTEANNLAIKGMAYANRDRGRHIVVSSIEHDCILNSCRWLESQGFEVTYLPVDEYGLVSTESVEAALRKDTVLVSVMHANNEIGTIQPIRAIGAICHEHGVYFHTDACQTFGKIPLDANGHNIGLATINAHKIYGPKGVGALYVREGVNIEPWEHGGGQERGLRSATENVPGIVGFARAAELCFKNLEGEARRLLGLRDRLIDGTMESLDFAYLNGHRVKRLPNNANFGFDGYEGDAIRLLLMLNEAGVAVSTGSACSSNSSGTSHVLTAIGLNPLQARGSLRVTPGRFNTEEDVEYFLRTLPVAVRSLRAVSTITHGGYLHGKC